MGSFTAQSVLIAIVIAATAHTGSAKKVPYLVSLEKNGLMFCSGAILDDKTIIATAYCVIDTKGYPLKDRIGFTVKVGDETKQVEEIIHYKDPSKTSYDLNGAANIIIIKLKEGLDIDNDPDLARVNLPNVLSRDNHEGKILTVTTTDTTEKMWKLRISTNNTCKYNQNDSKNDYICAEFLDSQASNCMKMKYGPLVHNNTLLGLHFYYHTWNKGKTCDILGFVNISAHLGFIINAIQENYVCNMRVLKV